ncbi:DUF2567 domain-containing protein [Micromonospora andamanensis]|uniref:DUF2567 domain-containing protein n=1 Tax=Micromonospora andamanensis TaxID=1287068 RepID=A0ABQ4I3K2_9ACTN|nr:DUF2567 domain-containing protein [Micromonospora andamanensis]GIJ12463.1 hypothetical protein Van01_56770 [Micromonospora andamanensis]
MSPTTPAAEPPARPPAALPTDPTTEATEPAASSTEPAGPTTDPAAPAAPTDPTVASAGSAEPTTDPAWPITGRPEGRGRTAAFGVATVLVMGLLGAPLGWLWAAVAPATPVVKSADGAVYGQAQPEQPIAADGWFSLLGLAFGVLGALAVWFLLRRHRGPVGLVVAAAGGLAAALVAWQVGRRVGLAGYQRLLETAPDGTRFSKPADLRAGGIELFLGVLPVPYGNVLLPAFAAAVMYTLLAGWSRWPSLRPEPEPDLAWLAAQPPAAPEPVGPEPDGAWRGPQPPPIPGPAEEVSSGPAGVSPAPPAAPEPPAPGAAEPPRG